jgi:RNA polymerase I-specific transcription initiation factor RRN3
MGLMPTLPSQLLGLLLQNLPHKLRDRSTQCLYLRGAFALAEGPCGRAIRDELLVGVVDHLLTIDVEIRWEDIVDQRTGGCEGKQQCCCFL